MHVVDSDGCRLGLAGRERERDTETKAGHMLLDVGGNELIHSAASLLKY